MPVAVGPVPTKTLTETLLRGFLLKILPSSWEVVLGQANRVPEPTNDNFACVIFTGLKRLATTVDTWSADTIDPPTTLQHEQSTAAQMQIQVFGADGFDGVTVITTLLRSSYACQFFAGTGVAPLFCDEGQQVPFTDGEHQYEDRWIVEAQLQLSVEISTTQQFADTLEIDLHLPVDLEPVA